MRSLNRKRLTIKYQNFNLIFIIKIDLREKYNYFKIHLSIKFITILGLQMKKLFLTTFVILIAILVIINYRTPFLKQNGGPWSIGFGESTIFPDCIPVNKNAKYPLEQLKTFNDSTKFLADPFFIKVKDTFYLFFEHKKIIHEAEIGLLTSTDGKNYNYRGTVLRV